jgi:short subunit dehydrogenase-like uncharacterized protein
VARLLIYGANGYTGRLIARAAAARGLNPLLAGRNRAAVAALAAELNCEARTFDLAPADALAGHLAGADVVLHCAGPFSRTAVPMLEACLARGIHYLDITGEIDVFALCHAADARAQARGIVVLPGAGFDVVPTDCVAAMLKERLPDATQLVLAFEAGGGPSPGTAKTSIEGLANGGRVRIDGRLTNVPLAWKTRAFVRNGKSRSAMTIPWGDVYTAHVSTGIPNIETYMVMPPQTIVRARRMRLLRPLLRIGAIREFVQRRIERSTPGPSAQRRQDSGAYVWGEVRNAADRAARLELSAPNGYELTVTASLGIAERLLAGPAAAGGYYTPSRLMGARYVLTLPGTTLIEEPG